MGRPSSETIPTVDKPRCYIASPLGFTEAGRDYYARVYLPALTAVVDPVDPWALTSATEVARASARGQLAELNLRIGRRNVEAIRSCTVLAAYLDGQELDSGTVAELGYGAGIGLRCFGLRTDLRLTGERDARVNLQVQTFIVDSGGTMTGSLDELVAALGSAEGD
jgi:nucleoside 2-deoxyribosyltransferase